VEVIILIILFRDNLFLHQEKLKKGNLILMNRKDRKITKRKDKLLMTIALL
jgi:hypothetical protein